MKQTVFGDSRFSNAAGELYLQVAGDDIVKKHMAIIDGYHAPTGVHLRGVALMMAEFATSGIVAFAEDAAHKAVRTAMLHDAGKITTPLTILDKPGPLTDTEWIEIHKHPLNGFHHLAFSELGPEEAIPVLLHHTLQVREYPSKEDCVEATAIHGVKRGELFGEEALTLTAMIAVADQMEARYPIHDDENPMAHIRSYANRRYSEDELPALVHSSFIEAGQIREINLTWLLDKLIECSQEVIAKKPTASNQ